MRNSAALIAAVITALVSAMAPPATAAPKGMPYRITADRGTTYKMVCKFRYIRVWGRGLANQFTVQDQGSTRGNLPSTDNARCVLTKLKGPGSVVLNLTVAGAVRTATATRIGTPVRLSVF